MPAGEYRFTISGFYRYGNIENAWVAHNNGTEGLNAQLYIQTGDEIEQAPFMSIFDSSAPFTYSPDYTYPDNVTQAHIAFNMKGAYQCNAVEIKLPSDGGDLRVGMKKSIATTYDWTCFDNARLYYRKGVDPVGINKLSPSHINNEDVIYDLSGRQMVDAPTKGVYLINGKKTIRR